MNARTLPDSRSLRRYATEQTPRAGVILFCHGLGLTAAKFEDLYPRFTARGYDVVTFDALGHGASLDYPVTSDSLDAIADAAIEVYARIACEHPTLCGVGAFGAFLMGRIVEHADEPPAALFYCPDYAPIPRPIHRFVGRHRRLLRWLDRVRFGYDYRQLTHDAADNERFMEDPTVWTRLRLGMVLRMTAETNAFLEASARGNPRHAFIIGSEMPASPVERMSAGVWRIEGGRMHLHRDRADIIAAFDQALGQALDYLHAAG